MEWNGKVMEAEHTMHVEDLRNQLERLNTKNAQQEEYVRVDLFHQVK